MEAKDTVIDGEHLADLLAMDNAAGSMDKMGRRGEEKREAAMLQAQAEISFKAGFNQGQLSRDNAAFKRGKLAGIKEVVDFNTSMGIGTWSPKYQAKLREWGYNANHRP